MPKGVEVQVLLAAPMRDRLMVGQRTLNPFILGSIPSPATKLFNRWGGGSRCGYGRGW